jgi:hypothetical protein
VKTPEKGVVPLFLVLFGSAIGAPTRQVSVAQPQRPRPACKYEQNCECPVPGITLRWKAAYCMALNETDDFEQSGVTECLDRPDDRSLTSRSACAQNAHWKEQWCRLLDKEPAAARQCIADPKMMPRIVEFGAGG